MKTKNTAFVAVLLVLLTITSSVSAAGLLQSQQEDGSADTAVADSQDVTVIQPEYQKDLVNVSVENKEIVYTYDSVPEELNYTVGSIIVGQTGYGYLRRVTSMERDGNTVRLATENVALSEVLRNTTINYSQNISLDQISSTQGYTPYVKVNYDKYRSYPMCWNGDLSEGNAKLFVNFSATGNLNTVFKARTSWGTLKSLYCGANLTINGTLSLYASYNMTINESRILKTFSFQTITVWAGIIPIRITPRLDFGVGADVELRSHMTVIIPFQMSFSVAKIYSNGQWIDVKELSKDLGINEPDIEKDFVLDAMGYGIARFSLLIYGSVGPYVEVNPYLRLHANISEVPWWSMYWGLKAVLGINLGFLAKYLGSIGPYEIYHQEWLIADASSYSACGAPRGLSARAGNTQVILSWEPPEITGGVEVTNYKIYRGMSSGTETLHATVGNATTYRDVGLTNDQTYYYKVSAVSTAGEGAKSYEISAMPTTVVTTPGRPYNLVAEGRDQHVNLSWDPPSNDGGSDITGYNIYRGTTSGEEIYLTTIGNVTLYSDVYVTNGETYYYKVAAVNAVGEGLKSSESSATPIQTATEPTEPRNLAAEAGDQMVNLSWEPPFCDGGSEITNYNIYRGTASGGETYLTTVGNVLNYQDTGLTNGQAYYYIVTAENGVGESIGSNEASATPRNPNTPIRINSNADFSTYANGGDGTAGNPWILQNYVIDGSGYGYCIYIGNTTDYFILRDSVLYLANGRGDAYYWDSGLILYNVTAGFISNISSFYNDLSGILLTDSGNVFVVDSYFSDNFGMGMYLDWSSGNSMSNNTILNNWYSGIYLYSSDSNDITENNASDNWEDGICLQSSNSNTLSNNSALGNWNTGIYLNFSDSNSVRDNDASHNYEDGIQLYDSYSNTVSDNRISDNWNGIYLELSDWNNITYNSVLYNWNIGIYLYASYSNTVSDNTISENWGGIYLEFSKWNDILYNYVSYNWDIGVYFYASDNNTISDNNISKNWDGLYLEFSDSNSIIDNTILGNEWAGIYLLASSNDLLSSNIMADDGIFIWGSELEYWNTHTIDSLNTVNGASVYYLKNQTGGTIPSGAGEVILANCNNVIVENQDIGNSTVGIELGFSNHNSILSCSIVNNYYGLMLVYSDNNSIKDNYASANLRDGISACYSANNTIMNNTAASNLGSGVWLYSATDNEMINNILYSNSNGLYLTDASYDNLITGNIAFNNSNGISIESSDSNNITDNIAFDNYNGVYLYSSYINDIVANNVSYNWAGICLNSSHVNTISYNNVFNNSNGIYLDSSDSNTITKNTAFDNDNGIFLFSSSSNDVGENNISDNWAGINLNSAHNNYITDNTITDNTGDGVFISFSRSNFLSGNLMYHDGIWISGQLDDWNTQIIDESNTVDGRPVYYWANRTGGTLPLDAGQIILANCSNVVVQNQNISSYSVSSAVEIGFSSFNIITSNTISNEWLGIYLYASDNNTISSNNMSENWDGIYLDFSNDNTFTSNNVFDNWDSGIYLFASEGNIISDNSVSDNWNSGICFDLSWHNTIYQNTISENYLDGISLYSSDNNSIDANNIYGNTYGTYMFGSDANLLSNNTVSDSYWAGIYIDTSTNNNISGTDFSNDNVAIWLTESNSNILYNNIISDSYLAGIYLDSAIENTVSKNTLSGNYLDGVSLDYSSNNSISNNTVSTNWDGIHLFSSDNNSIADNAVSDNSQAGIYLHSSENNTLFNNSMSHNGIFLEGNQLEYWNTHNIDTSNTVNGKPVYYWKNQIGGSIPLGAGQVLLANCTSVSVVTQDVSNGSVGVEIGFSNNNSIMSSVACNNTIEAISLYYSDWNTVSNNNASSNSQTAVHVVSSANNTVANNTLSGNDYGVWLEMSSNSGIYNNTGSENTEAILLSSSRTNKISNNTLLNNSESGIWLISSDDNTISNNTASNNWAGVYIYQSANNTLSNNTMINDGIYIWSYQLKNWNTHHIDTLNTVNGKSVYYFKDMHSGTVASDAGQIILANCTGIIIENQTLGDGTVGIEIGFSDISRIMNTTLSNNTADGIDIIHSNGTEMSNITSSNNDWEGIMLYSSTNTTISGSLTVNNSGDGIGVYDSDKSTISNITSSNNRCDGIFLYSSNDATIFDSLTSNNTGNGINLYQSTGNIISNTTLQGNEYGLELYADSNNNTLKNNTIVDNYVGIDLYFYSINNSLEINTILNNSYGVALDTNCSSNTLIDNNMSNNSYGVYLYGYSTNNTMWGGIVSNNNYGVVFDTYCDNNTLVNATLSNNSFYGVYINSSSNNKIYHNNFISNANQAYDGTGNNEWNIMYPVGGNYWSDYTGIDKYHGSGQDIFGSDGIGDSAYTAINGVADIQDNYPIMQVGGCAPSSSIQDIVPYWQNSNVTLTLTASDDNGLTSITLYYRFATDNFSWSDWSQFGSSVSISGTTWSGDLLFTFPLGQGYYEFYTVARDGDSNVEVKNTRDAACAFDETNPTVSITSPADGTVFATNLVTVSWTGNDSESGINHYELRIDGGLWTDIGANTTYDFTGLSDSPHTVDVKAVDNAGNENIDSVTFTTDTTNPTVSITTPTTGAIFNTNSVTVTWASSDATSGINHYEVRIDGSSWTDVGTNTSYDFTGLSDGTHTADVKAVDNATNEATDSGTFTTDTINPTVSITAPTGAILNTSSFTVTWTGSDATSGIDHYEVQIDGGSTWTDVGTATSYTFSTLSDGPHTVDVKAVDKAENEATDSVSFTIDVTEPTVSITSPADGTITGSNSMSVSWTGSDATSGINHYEIRIDGGSWTDIGTNTSYEFTGLSDGSHTVDVKAVDNTTNEATDSVTFITDATNPTVSITTPTTGAMFNTNTVTVTWTGSDATSGINHYEIRIDGGSWTNVGTETSYEFTDLSDGNHTVEVKVVDNATSEATDSTRFTMDATAPKITDNSPTGTEVPIDSPIMVTFNESINKSSLNITLNGISGSVTWKNNTAIFTPAGTLNYETEYIVNITASDIAGNVMEYKWSFTTVNNVVAETGTIVGSVLDEDGNPIVGAVVSLDTGETATTNESGYYSIDASAGAHTLTISKEGYETRTENVTVASGTETDIEPLKLPVAAASTDESGGAFPWTYVLVAIIIGAVVVLMLVKGKKTVVPENKAESEEGPDTDEDSLPEE